MKDSRYVVSVARDSHDPIVFCCQTNSEWVKRRMILSYHAIFLSQEFRQGSAGWFFNSAWQPLGPGSAGLDWNIPDHFPERLGSSAEVAGVAGGQDCFLVPHSSLGLPHSRVISAQGDFLQGSAGL